MVFSSISFYATALCDMHMRHRSLFRYYANRKWAEAFLDGRLRFWSLAYFRDYEDEIRGDPNEGRNVFRPEGGPVIHNVTRGTTFPLPGGAFEALTKQEEIFVFCLSNP